MAAYRLRAGEPLAAEVRRVATEELGAAIAELRTAGATGDGAVHRARRHIKKGHALFRLARPSLTRRHRASHERFNALERLLAPFADAEAAVEALNRLVDAYPDELSPHLMHVARSRLVERWRRAGRRADATGALPQSMKLLRIQRSRVRLWQLGVDGLAALEPGLREIVRRSRKAMAQALGHGSSDNFYYWRRRVKDHWLQLRLLEGTCDDRLADFEAGLEALDGALGEYHDSRLLQRAVVRTATLSRVDRAHLLRLSRRYGADRRRRAVHLGAQLYDESAEHQQIALLRSSPVETRTRETLTLVERGCPGAA
jgi:hypothetical protein